MSPSLTVAVRTGSGCGGRNGFGRCWQPTTLTPFFLSGCAPNQGSFTFDRIVLLTAPVALITKQLTTRTNNPFGKGPGELDKVLADKQAVEPLLRRIATLEVDTSEPVDQVVRAVLDHATG